MSRADDLSHAAERETTPEYVSSQTVGPYYAIGMDYLVSDTLAGADAAGQRVTLSGTVFDAAGEPVPDCILELWQASPDGQYGTQPVTIPGREPALFSGFARLSTHAGGTFLVHTVVPGPVPFVDGRPQAPHIVVLVFMRGLVRHLVTRVYFPQELVSADALAADPILQLVPADRRCTLIARPIDGDCTRLQWDLHLQGEGETVCFAC